MTAPINIQSSTFRIGLDLARDVYANFGRWIVLLVGLTFASAVLEGLTLAALVPVLQFSDAKGQLQATGFVGKMLGALGGAVTFRTVAGTMAVLLVLSIGVFVAQAYLSTKLQSRYVALWQKRLFDSVISAEWAFLRRRRSGELVGALTTEATKLGGAFYQGNLIASAVIFLAVQIVIASVLAPAATWILIGVAVVLFRATRPLMRRAVRIGGDMTDANASFFSLLGEISSSTKSIKATGFEEQVKRYLSVQIDNIQNLTFQNLFDVQLVRAIFEYTSAALIVLLLLLGPSYLGIEPASVLVVLAIFVRLFPKVSGLRQWLHSVALLLPGYEFMQGLLREAESARERTHDGPKPDRSGGPAIQLRNLCVSSDRGEPLLHGVTLDIAPGEHVVFVGPSGAGKTTLLDCILGLAVPSAGDVLIDGHSINALSLPYWRHSIGYLGQEPVLLAATVRENVVWNRSGVSDESVIEALKAAGAEFAFLQPDGLDARVFEHGGSLSGGERQRIALARALLGAPRLLVLDEATSALDVESERRIAAALRRRQGELTILTVTHRLASARDADRVVLLEGGEVVEQGNFSELLAAEGRFAAMWRAHRDIGVEVAGVTPWLPH